MSRTNSIYVYIIIGNEVIICLTMTLESLKPIRGNSNTFVCTVVFTLQSAFSLFCVLKIHLLLAAVSL